MDSTRNRSKVLALLLRAAINDVVPGELPSRSWTDRQSSAVKSIESIAEELEALVAAPSDRWVVWSFEHEAWWGPRHMGYHPQLLCAGLYAMDEAKEIERRANAQGDRKEMALSLDHALAGERTRLSVLFGPVVVDLIPTTPDPDGGARG